MASRAQQYEDFLDTLRDEVRKYPNKAHLARKLGVTSQLLGNFYKDNTVCVKTTLVDGLMKFFRFEMILTIRRLPE